MHHRRPSIIGEDQIVRAAGYMTMNGNRGEKPIPEGDEWMERMIEKLCSPLMELVPRALAEEGQKRRV